MGLYLYHLIGRKQLSFVTQQKGIQQSFTVALCFQSYFIYSYESSSSHRQGGEQSFLKNYSGKVNSGHNLKLFLFPLQLTVTTTTSLFVPFVVFMKALAINARIPSIMVTRACPEVVNDLLLIHWNSASCGKNPLTAYSCRLQMSEVQWFGKRS